MHSIRLQKFLSECGVASRRASEKLIEQGKVKVNGQIIVEQGKKIDPMRDQVTVRNKIVKPPAKGIVLFHKPRGVVSTLQDPQERPTIADYLTKHLKSFFPVGRLDFDSTGLIILTNDGELAQHLLHPRYEMIRKYHARVAGALEERTMRKLEAGVRLDDGVAKALSVTLLSNERDSTWVEVSVAEGRNRLIRRMFDKIHHPVMKLKRVAHGPFLLGKLRAGEMRKLNDREYRYFRRKLLEVNSSPRKNKSADKSESVESTHTHQEADAE